MNGLKTASMLGLMTLLIVLPGKCFGGVRGMVYALAVAGVLNCVFYFFSDKFALIRYQAYPVGSIRLRHVREILDRLSARIGIPAPKLYLTETQSPNAFAIGRGPNHASIVVTEGIVRLLTNEELEGVLAHELAHICNRDVLSSSILATLVGLVTLLPRMAVWAVISIYSPPRDQRRKVSRLLTRVVAPVAAVLVRPWISPSREFEADAGGANYTGNPRALARALQKLDSDSKRIPMRASSAMAHLLIVQPWMGTRRAALLSTHPPIAQRIERLMERAAEMPLK